MIKRSICRRTKFSANLIKKTFRLLIWLVLPFLCGKLVAQQVTDSTGVSTEVVDVVKSYAPSINLRPKSKWNLPESDGSRVPRPEFSYTHENLGFTPSNLPTVLRAKTPKKEVAQENLPNYLRLWLGTRESAGIEGFISHEINRDSYWTTSVEHQQLNGPIEGVAVSTDWAKSGVRIQWRNKWENRLSTLGLSFKRSALQWYGVPDTLDLDPAVNDDFGQTYLMGSLYHRLGSNGGWFTGFDNELSFFSDRYGVSEWKYASAPKAELIWDKRTLSFTGNLSFLSTKFNLEDALIDAEDYNALNVDLGAQTDFDFGDFKVNLGARIWGHNSASGSTLRLFPELELSYPVVQRSVNAYAGFSGQYRQYEASSLTQIQSFLAPGLTLKPQVDRQILRLGINGALNDRWQYNLGVEFRNFEDQAYFVRRPWSGLQGAFAYDNGNSYSVNYDGGTELKYAAKINGRLSQRWDFSLDASIIDNRPLNNTEPWNIPSFSYGGSGSYHIGEQILLTGRFLSYGPRKDQMILADQVITQEVDGFIDAQLHINYAMTKNFSASLSGINLLNQKNGLWVNYPVQGIRVNLGLQYNFSAF